MKIDNELCVSCGLCIPYCPVGAISRKDDVIQINNDICVECHICDRAKICPTGALQVEELQWPRNVRAILSDVTYISPETGLGGRGTEEMKTNEITGRFKKGDVGIAIEMGRPGIGTSLVDIEKVAMAVAKCGVHFEPNNPFYFLLEDSATGKFKSEVLNERVMSGIIEFIIPITKMSDVLRAIEAVSGEIETVFSLDIATVTDAGKIPTDEIINELGMERKPNCKVNIGLGRPRREVI